MAFAAIAIAVALGWTVVRLVLPAQPNGPRWARWLFEASLAVGAGIGLTSSLFFLLLLAGAAGRGMVMAAESALLLGLGVVLARRTRPEQAAAQATPETNSAWNTALALALAAGAALVAVSFFQTAQSNPYGAWDAWSIWNLRAKFLAAPGDTWRYAFSPLLRRTHPDYPLLLSGFVARSWKYAGAGTAAGVPIVTAFLFQFAAGALLVSVLALARNTALGLLAGLVLLESSSFLQHGAYQYADVPLSFYILASLSLLLLAGTPGAHSRRFVALAGCCAAFGAWTKNEGILAMGLLLSIFFVVEGSSSGWRPASAKAGYFLLGALPAAAIVVCFKLFLAPAADPLVQQTAGEALRKIGEGARYSRIASAYFAEALRIGSGWTHPFWGLAVLAAALRFRISPWVRHWLLASVLTIAGILSGYFFIYVITPSGLEWHLSTSLSRLYSHVWPSVLLVVFTAFGWTESAAPERAPRKKKGRSKRG